jgi:hypothetical protein
MDEVSVIWGVKGGDCGKLGEAGNVEEVSLDNADDALKDFGGMSHSDMPGSFFSEAIARTITLEGSKTVIEILDI